jgi:hypothetical protein
MKIRYLVPIAALTLFCAVATAGLVMPAAVTIDFAARSAQGDMNTARNSDDKVTYIGCNIANSPGFPSGFCQAGIGAAAEQQINCFTFDPAMLEAIHGISDFSFVRFTWNESFECTRIYVSTQSFYLPDFKVNKK